MSFSISMKKFRNVVDDIDILKDSVMIKTAYLLAARNCEVITRTSPVEILTNASKPYGVFLDFEVQDFEVKPATQERKAEIEKVLLVKCAVAKRGKKMKATIKNGEPQAPDKLKHKEVVEALLKFKQEKLLERWKRKKVKIDPLLIKVLLGKVNLKIVALPCSPKYEPWTLDLLQWIKKKGKLSFDMTRFGFYRVLRRNLSEIMPPVSRHTHKNLLRHFRISHLIEYYQFDPYQVTSYVGWAVSSTFTQMGMVASPMLDSYAHLRWRAYFPRLLRPIKQFTK